MIVPLLFLAGWQIYYELRPSGGFLASPYEVLVTIIQLGRDGTLLSASGASLSRIVLGVGVAIVVGVPLGVLVGWSPTMKAVCWPFLELLRQVPIPAWVPLMVLVLGIGDTPAIALISLAAFFPVFLNTISGVRLVPVIQIKAARMLGASNLHVLRTIVLPSAWPTIVNGIRIGMGIGVMVVVLAELTAVDSGIGYMIEVGQEEFKGSIVIAGMVTISVIGWVLSRLIGVVESRSLRHRL